METQLEMDRCDENLDRYTLGVTRKQVSRAVATTKGAGGAWPVQRSVRTGRGRLTCN